ncbi:MAG: NADH-quinone oxidoreductase subunit N [Ekhidna sp.]
MSILQQLTDILNDLQLVKTESALMIGAIVLLISGLITKSNRLLKGVFALVIVAALYFNSFVNETGLALSNGIFISSISQQFSNLFLMTGLILLLYERGEKHSAEFYFFILSLLIGSVFMMKANSLLIIYISIELASFASYILTNFSFRKAAHEAGIKYLLFGAVSSAIMLFGIGLIYGTTHTFYLHEWQLSMFETLLPQVGLLMFLMGIFFKASIVPLHIWVPATYQSAPNDATAFMSIVPKLAAFILLSRVVQTGILPTWIINASLSLGMLTIIFGTFGALKQANVRRMISFGAIAHSGFLLPFVFMNSETALESFWWYSCVYAVMNLAVFYLVDAFERQAIFTRKDYAKSSKETWIGVAMTIILVSLIGLPPLAGFTGKLLLFSSLWEFFDLSSNQLYVGYLIIALFATVISLFFYLRIPQAIFLTKRENEDIISFNLSTKIIATLFAMVLILLFFVPQILQ